MHRIRSLTGAFVVGAFLLVAGCTDAPTAPVTDPVEPQPGLLSDLLDHQDRTGEEVAVLRRAHPLADDEVVSKVIGYEGGIVRLPEAGLTVVVPWGALRERTRITVRAPAGDLVGYHFEPHGLEFRYSVTLMQDMQLTDLLSADGLSVAYFRGDLEPTVTALESLPLWLLRNLGVFEIEHFSGYVIATN